jgi:hypothetical protein
VDITAIIAGVGAILTATGGTLLVVHEFRRRDHLAANRQRELLSDDLAECRDELVRSNQMTFEMRQRMAEHGVEIPKANER